MNGKDAYEEKFNRRIRKIIAENPDRPYIQGFYNYMGSSRLSCYTKYNYTVFVMNFMRENNKKIEDLNLDDYTNFLAKTNNMTSSYQIGVYSALKKFATYLIASQKTTYNPMEYIQKPKHKEKEETIAKREIGFLEKREINKYITSVQEGSGTDRAIARQENWKERDLLIVLIFLNTGMRCAALFKLDVNSIDFVNHTLTTNDKGDHVKTYVLSNELMQCINDWLVKRQEILGDVKTEALFISNRKTRMDQTSIYRIVKKYDKINGKNITPHKLRATYGTQLLKETRDIYFVQQCMGHSSPQTTELYIRGENKYNEVRACDIMSKIVKI